MDVSPTGLSMGAIITVRVTGPDITASPWHKFTLATFLCWCLTSVVLDDRTLLHVRLQQCRRNSRAPDFALPYTVHMTRFGRRCDLTSKYHLTQEPLVLTGVDRGGDFAPDWE